MILKKANVDISKYENIYVTSDIHGHYEEFMALLDKIRFSENDLLIVNGDCIDRGYDNLSILDYCFTTENVVLLMGNHEHMLTSMISGDYDMFENWTIYNGGNKTYSELQNLKVENKNEFNKTLSMVNDLPHYIELDINDNKYLIVHAGVRATNFSPKIDELMAIQGKQAMWVRGSFLKSKYKTPFTVIFGHTPTFIIDYEINNNYPTYYLKKSYDGAKVLEEAKKSKIWHGTNKIGIDCGLYSGGKLGCLRLNDMEEFYIDKNNY